MLAVLAVSPVKVSVIGLGCLIRTIRLVYLHIKAHLAHWRPPLVIKSFPVFVDPNNPKGRVPLPPPPLRTPLTLDTETASRPHPTGVSLDLVQVIITLLDMSSFVGPTDS
jgi:hypothetical protein